MSTPNYAYHDALMRRIGMIEDLGTSATQLAQAQQATQAPSFDPSGMPSPNQQQGSFAGNSKGGFGAFLQAIAGQESGGNYGVRNKDSGAMGKYQIMPSNILGSGKGWDYEALGRDVSLGEFLGSPKIQEAIAQYKLRSYYQKYGPAGASVAWYAGPGTASSYLKNPRNYTISQGTSYPSIGAYVQQVLARMG